MYVHLNTSHVIFYHRLRHQKNRLKTHLNTSHVIFYPQGLNTLR